MFLHHGIYWRRGHSYNTWHFSNQPQPSVTSFTFFDTYFYAFCLTKCHKEFFDFKTLFLMILEVKWFVWQQDKALTDTFFQIHLRITWMDTKVLISAWLVNFQNIFVFVKIPPPPTHPYKHHKCDPWAMVIRHFFRDGTEIDQIGKRKVWLSNQAFSDTLRIRKSSQII
jgi:hypothetical protein